MEPLLDLVDGFTDIRVQVTILFYLLNRVDGRRVVFAAELTSYFRKA
jgi:hypothetical protein